MSVTDFIDHECTRIDTNGFAVQRKGAGPDAEEMDLTAKISKSTKTGDGNFDRR
jgi:hypothetical protein